MKLVVLWARAVTPRLVEKKCSPMGEILSYKSASATQSGRNHSAIVTFFHLLSMRSICFFLKIVLLSPTLCHKQVTQAEGFSKKVLFEILDGKRWTAV